MYDYIIYKHVYFSHHYHVILKSLSINDHHLSQAIVMYIIVVYFMFVYI